MWEKDKWLKAAYVTGNTKEAYESCPPKKHALPKEMGRHALQGQWVEDIVISPGCFLINSRNKLFLQKVNRKAGII